MPGAAFFDLDRTLISRSSSLALAGTFRRRGLIGRRQHVTAALAQLVFTRFGAGQARVGQTANTGMSILEGLPVELMREIAAEAWEPVLKPLVYREALDLAAAHAERGERVFIASAALQEVVEEVSNRLGFDGAIASRAATRDGVFTGRLERRLYGQAKADALVEFAAVQELDLASFDGVLGLPLRCAVSRGGRSSSRRESGSRAASNSGRARVADRDLPTQGVRGVTAAEARDRLSSLGFTAETADVLVAHFEDAERRGKRGHGFSRIDWLASLDLEPAARPVLIESEEGFERWDGHGALGYVVLDEIVRATLDDPPERARVVVASRCFPTGVLGYWVRRLAEGGLVAALTATSPRRLAPPGGGDSLTGTNPLAIAIPSSDRRPIVTDVSMGAVTHGDVLEGRAAVEELVPFGGEQAHKAFALAVGLELFVSALVGEEPGAVLVVAQPDHDPVPAFRELADGVRLPGDS